MGKLRGFMEHERVNEQNIAVQDRVKNYKEFTVTPSEETLQEQGARVRWIAVFRFATVVVRWGI